jgi:hypothetical protein
MIDLEELARQIQEMNYTDPLYKVLKQELSARGWWKNKPRGKADVFHFTGAKQS